MKKSVLLPTDENLVLTIKEDLLDRNSELNSFCHLLSHQNSINSIALDGRWGSGKTFFVKQCALLLNAKNSLSNLDKQLAHEILEVCKKSNSFDGLQDNNLLAVYFDAWENDSEEDPVLSLIYRITQQLDLDSNQFDLSHLTHLLTTISDVITGKPISNVIDGLNEKNFLDKIRKKDELNTCIRGFFEEILCEKAEHLIIFIDELDRCRPSYAVRLLERIEHYFINDRITFVFSVNLEQLQHTIKNFYGNDFDACRYMDRFFDLRLSLPHANLTKFYQGLNIFDVDESSSALKQIQKTFNLSLRELCKFIDIVNFSGKNNMHNETQWFMFKYIIMLSLALKIIDVTLHKDFINGRNWQPLLDLYDNDFGVYICRKLLNNNEILIDGPTNTHSETEKEEVTREEKLIELYEAIFTKNYTNVDYVTRVGSYAFTKDSKQFIFDVESSLSKYSRFDWE